jgi:ribosome-binding factor A
MNARDDHDAMPSAGDRRLRVRRVDSLLTQVIQQRLARGLADPRYRGLVSVTGVHVSPDLRAATVHVSVLPDKYGKRVLAALKSAKGVLRRELRNECSMKYVPDLDFRLDDSMKRDAALADAIRSDTDFDSDETIEKDRGRPESDDS